MFVEHNQLLTRSQIKWIGGRERQYIRHQKIGKQGKVFEYTIEECDKLVKMITEGNYEYCLCYQESNIQTKKRSCRTSIGSKSHCKISLETETNDEMDLFADDRRSSLSVKEDQKLMIMIA